MIILLCTQPDTFHPKSDCDRPNALEMNTIKNYAMGDAVQFMASTSGKIIYGQNQGLRWRTRRTRQIGGYISDVLLQ